MATDTKLQAAFRRLFRAAKRFEDKAPHDQRLEPDRAELREALVEASLVLSVIEDRTGKQGDRGHQKPRTTKGARGSLAHEHVPTFHVQLRDSLPGNGYSSL